MRPFLLKGHTRPISKVLYNRDGDLLFSAGLDGKVCAWYSHNGERLGTYNGHRGAVWSLDVNFDTSLVLTGSADTTAKLWNAETGTEIYTWEHKSAVRSVAFSHGEHMIMTVQDDSFKNTPTIFIHQYKKDRAKQSPTPLREMVDEQIGKVTVAVWGPLNETIIAGGDDGTVRIWDVETGKRVRLIHAHKKQISDIQFSKDYTMFITSSTDQTAKLFDTKSSELKKTYISDRPLNSACISPILNHVITGGGQEARDVTTTHAQMGRFEADIYHTVLENKLGSVKGHFGPLNTLAFSPDGRGFASGGEDGYVRLHHFDSEYFKFKDN